MRTFYENWATKELSDNFLLRAMTLQWKAKVFANIVPKDVADMTHAFLNGDWKRARELHLRLFPLSQAMFIETNPIPVKTSLAMMGKIKEEFRLPLCPMTEVNRKKLETALRNHGLLS